MGKINSNGKSSYLSGNAIYNICVYPPLLCPTSLKLRMAIQAFVLHVTTMGVVVVRLAMVVCGGGGSVLYV